MTAAAHGLVEISEITKSCQSSGVQIIELIEGSSVENLSLIDPCLALDFIREQHALPSSDHRLDGLSHGVQIQSPKSFPLQQQPHGLVGVIALAHRDPGHHIGGLDPGLPQVLGHQVAAHAEAHADDGGGGEPPDHVLDHGGVVGGVTVHEDPGASDGDGGEGPHVVDYTHAVAIELGVIHHSPEGDIIGNYSLFPSRRKKMTSYDGKLAILCHVIVVMTIFSYFVEMAIESALFVSVKL